MADYTEKASLMVVDGSSAKINKINQALSNLAKTAARTQAQLNKLGNGGTASKINATAKAVGTLARNLNKLPKSSSIGVKLRGSSAADLRAMARAMAQYKSASKNINTLIGAGGKGANYNNLDVLTAKLIRVARAANLAQIALGKVKANIPSGPGSRNPFAQPPGRQPPARNIGLELQPLKSLLRSFVVDLGHQIVSSVKEAFAEGIKGYDVAQNKFSQQRITGPAAEELRQRAFAGERRAPIWRADERMDFYAEVGSNFKDPRDASKFDQYIEKAIYTAVQQGGTRDEATTGVAELFKGLGNAGYLQDAQGNVNKDIGKYIDAYTAAKTSEGAQINFKDAAQLLKYAKTSAQSLSPREFFLQLIASADIGASTAGVQLNGAMKNYAGETTKKALQAQEDAGLRGPGTLVKSGSNNGKTSYTYEAGKVVDEDLLRENPSEWIQKNIFGPGGFLEKKGLDVNKSSSAQILSALDPLAGNRNTDDFLAKTVLQYQERAIKASKYFENPTSMEEIQRTNVASSWVQLQETTQQLISLFGNLGDKLKNTYIPVIDTIGNWAERLNALVEGRSKGEMQDYALLGGAGAAGIAGGALGISILKNLATGFGLPAAAVALTGSAEALTLAAARLGGAGVADAAGDAAGGGKGSWMKWLAIAGSYGAAVSGAFVPSSSPQATPEGTRQQNAANNQSAANYFADQYASSVAAQQADRDRVQPILQQIATIQSNIDLAKANGNDAYAMVQQGKLETLQTTAGILQQQMQDRSATILSAFETASTAIGNASEGFGTTAAQNILDVASSFGAAAGAAMKGAFGDIAFTVPPELRPAAPNTGTNSNLQTGG